MAHFAKLNENNIVETVIVVANEELLINGVESEEKGIQFCVSLFGGKWIQTSYNNNFRKNYASIGGYYDPDKDEFVLAKPYDSWILNSNNDWEPPFPKPTTDGDWEWDETEKIWKR